MTNEYQIRQGCSEEYAELCALSTSGELNAEEWTTLEQHVATCASCSALLAEYTSLVQVAMPKIAPETVENVKEAAYQPRKVEARLVAALHSDALAAPIAHENSAVIHLVAPEKSVGVSTSRRRISWKISAGIAAMLVAGIAGAFQLGRRSAIAPSVNTSQPPAGAAVQTAGISPTSLNTDEKARLDAEKSTLQEKLAAAQTALVQSDRQSADAEKHVADLTSALASLQSQVDSLTKQNQLASASLTTVSQQRDGLQQQLVETTKSLELVRADLDHAQQARQGAVLRVASLENEVNTLHTTMAVTNRSASTNEQFLAQDRDIRELMGARQLYIADVLDVQGDGSRSKPFGRVFYTKGKSLVFYAFDLQGQPGYREAQAFQAWGKPDSSSDKPISLGIFYMDSAANKRWVLKSDNPAVLAQINAVFVTVEPQGGSAKPTGKPFLEAYLHTIPPNHP